MSMVVVHVASGTRDILVFLGRMAEAMGHALLLQRACASSRIAQRYYIGSNGLARKELDVETFEMLTARNIRIPLAEVRSPYGLA